jgi:toxin-antitoxin system PIN domain toxin
VTAALLDVSLLTALIWPTHVHHEIAKRWFHARDGATWASCAITQLGFVRLACNPAFSKDAFLPEQAMALLEQNVRRPDHEFWDESMQVWAALRPLSKGLQGRMQLTDAYLLALAASRKAVFATLDKRVVALAGREFASALEVVPSS